MQQIFDFPVTPVCSFESFVVCDGTMAAYAFARRIADPDDADNLLYLYGPPGSGKTHLLKAIAVRMVSAAREIPYISCRDLSTVDELMARFQGMPVLVVDDLHLLGDDPALRAGIWQVFNEFYSAGRPVVMAGLLPPRELPLLDDHLVSRLLWGLVARVDVSDDVSRRMILKKVADDRQVLVPDDLVDYILATTGREVGELISAFERVYRLSLARKRKMSLALARECRHPEGDS